MPVVPQYQPGQVQQRGIFQQGVSVRSSADDMGAAIGRGLGAVGQGLGQAAEAVAAVQDLENVARAKEADNAFAGWLRERQYGEGGFLTLEGRNAVDQRAAFEAEVAEKRKEFGAGLTPGAQRAFDQASTARLNSTLDQSIVHTANQRKSWFTEASSARVDTFHEDAVAAYRNPAAVDKNLAAGLAEFRSMAGLQGWDADTLANKEAEFVSGVRYDVAVRMLADDPKAAKKYFDENRDQFTGPHQFKFEEAIKVPLTTANVLSHTDEFFTGSAGADYYANIKAAESGGVADAKNPNSSATGLYQFTTGTWDEMRRRHPELGLTAEGRTDPEQQERAIRVFTAENEQTLARNGINVTNGTRYAAHFLGAGGAVKVLRSDPEAKLTDILPSGVIEANSFLKGMTVSDFAAWAERKGGAGGGTPAAGAANAASQLNAIEPYLQTITDPTERELTRKAIYARITAEDKARTAQQDAVQARAFELIERDGLNPFDLPPEITTQIGMENMSQLMTYWEKRSTGEVIQTDDNVLYDLNTKYATDPAAFAQENLLKYRNQLSDADWKTVNGWRQTALTDQRKAGEEGLALTGAFSQATTQLEALGITTTGKKGSQRDEAAARIAQFNNVLAQQMAELKAANEGRNQTQMDIQSMVNRLLLPIVVEEPGRLWGTRRTEGNFLFEADTIANEAQASVSVEYADIPRSLRVEIETDLSVELGRKPSPEEVSARYNQVIEETIRGDN